MSLRLKFWIKIYKVDNKILDVNNPNTFPVQSDTKSARNVQFLPVEDKAKWSDNFCFIIGSSEDWRRGRGEAGHYVDILAGTNTSDISTHLTAVDLLTDIRRPR